MTVRHIPILALLLATQAFLSGLASAQTPPASTPQTASAPTYRSALDGYQPFADEKLAPWKESNDNVGRIGGWRVYAKEASEGGAAPSAAPAGAASAAKPPASVGGPALPAAPSTPASAANPASVATPVPAATPSTPAARPSGGHGKH